MLMVRSPFPHLRPLLDPKVRVRAVVGFQAGYCRPRPSPLTQPHIFRTGASPGFPGREELKLELITRCVSSWDAFITQLMARQTRPFHRAEFPKNWTTRQKRTGMDNAGRGPGMWPEGWPETQCQHASRFITGPHSVSSHNKRPHQAPEAKAAEHSEGASSKYWAHAALQLTFWKAETSPEPWRQRGGAVERTVGYGRQKPPLALPQTACPTGGTWQSQLSPARRPWKTSSNPLPAEYSPGPRAQ
jgi:hypothetical protein